MLTASNFLSATTVSDNGLANHAYVLYETNSGKVFYDATGVASEGDLELFAILGAGGVSISSSDFMLHN